MWISEAMGARGDNLGEGIQLTGPGNVICYNYLHGFRDCISTMESQNVEDQICVDIYESFQSCLVLSRHFLYRDPRNGDAYGSNIGLSIV